MWSVFNRGKMGASCCQEAGSFSSTPSKVNSPLKDNMPMACAEISAMIVKYSYAMLI
jgi:hypothetical protein